MSRKRKPTSVYHYIAGYFFLFLGLIGGFIPILQGWIFVAIGLILLRDERWARKVHIWIHRRYPKSRPAFKYAYKKIDEWIAKLWGV
jgi:uncharacterized membrane protein YbaN (DUF454 family)